MPVLCNAAISNAADVGRNEIDDLAPGPASVFAWYGVSHTGTPAFKLEGKDEYYRSS